MNRLQPEMTWSDACFRSPEENEKAHFEDRLSGARTRERIDFFLERAPGSFKKPQEDPFRYEKMYRRGEKEIKAIAAFEISQIKEANQAKFKEAIAAFEISQIKEAHPDEFKEPLNG